MKRFTAEDISQLERFYRANLINSCTGYKSANLMGSRSKDGIENVAVFNSVVHIGSNPPLLGFILRPTTVPRHTFQNMKETGVFTVNQIHQGIIEDAHHTSASYDESISEFDKTNLTPIYKDDFNAPFVKESKIQLACSYVNDYLIEENGCYLVIGAIEVIYVPEKCLHEDGFVQLDKAESISIIGLDGYALPSLKERFPYARPK